jgi:hypothetical protein
MLLWLAAVVVLVVVIIVVVARRSHSGCQGPADCPAGSACGADGVCQVKTPPAGCSPPCDGSATCVDGRCVASPRCGAGPACAPTQFCANGTCYDQPACANGCTPPATCINGQCVITGCNPPCAGSASCVNGQCVSPPSGCGGGPACSGSQICLNGACAEPQGSCYAWKPLAIDAKTTMSMPSDAVGTTYPTFFMPLVGKEVSSGSWVIGGSPPPTFDPKGWGQAFYVIKPANVDTSSASTATTGRESPVSEAYYLAARPGCSLSPSTASDAGSAINFRGTPVCWMPGKDNAGLFTPYNPVTGKCYQAGIWGTQFGLMAK